MYQFNAIGLCLSLDVKIPKYIGAVLLSYKIYQISICFQPHLKLIFKHLILFGNILDKFNQNSSKWWFLIKSISGTQ